MTPQVKDEGEQRRKEGLRPAGEEGLQRDADLGHGLDGLEVEALGSEAAVAVGLEDASRTEAAEAAAGSSSRSPLPPSRCCCFFFSAFHGLEQLPEGSLAVAAHGGRGREGRRRPPPRASDVGQQPLADAAGREGRRRRVVERRRGRHVSPQPRAGVQGGPRLAAAVVERRRGLNVPVGNVSVLGRRPQGRPRRRGKGPLDPLPHAGIRRRRRRSSRRSSPPPPFPSRDHPRPSVQRDRGRPRRSSPGHGTLRRLAAEQRPRPLAAGGSLHDARGRRRRRRRKEEGRKEGRKEEAEEREREQIERVSCCGLGGDVVGDRERERESENRRCTAAAAAAEKREEIKRRRRRPRRRPHAIGPIGSLVGPPTPMQKGGGNEKSFTTAAVWLEGRRCLFLCCIGGGGGRGVIIGRYA